MKKVISILAVSLFVGLISFNPTNETKDHCFDESDDYALKEEKTIKFNKRMFKNPNVAFDGAIEDGAMVSNAKAQILDNGNNTYNIRFVSAVVWSDTSTLYSKIGFDVNYYYNNEWFSYSRDVSTLYTTLVAGSKTYNESNMSEFDNTSNYKYFVTYTLVNVPSSALDTHFEVRPYAYSLDGTLYSSKGSKVTSVNSVKGGYSTYKVFSKFENNDSSEIKYVEPVHDRNKKNEVVGAESTDVDTRAAKFSKAADGTRFIENASAYGKFQYTYEAKSSKGKLDIYANVASSKYIAGDVSTVWPGAKGGFLGSQAIDFTQFLTLKNNDKEFEVSKNAKIPETRLTSDMDPAIIKQEENIKKSAWGACTYFLLNNFRRIHIGTVDIAQGTNNIEIDIGYNNGQFGYAGSGCGNWQSIEVIYIDDNTDKTVKTIEMTSAPTKLQYKPGEKFDITGAEFVGYNADGVLVEKIDNSKIEILDNQSLYVDTKVRLKYQNVEFYVDVKVSGTIKQSLNSLKNMVIQYHDQTDESDTRRAGIVTAKGGYLEKVSSGSYFEYVIEADHEVTISISAEIASNGYVYKRGDYKDYNTGIEGFTQSWIGSYDLDMSRIVKLTNTINGETKSFETNKDAIAYGHMINAADDLEASKNYDLTTAKGQWSMADDLCMRQFKNIELGEIKLSKGTNTIRISMEGYLKENSFAYGGYACGNWKSVTITYK